MTIEAVGPSRADGNTGARHDHSARTNKLRALQLRLALWYSGIFGVVMVSFAVLIYVFLVQTLFHRLEEGARVVAHSVQATLYVDRQGLHAKPADFDDVAGDAGTFKNVSAIDVHDTAGKLVAVHGVALPDLVPGAAEDRTVDVNGNDLHVHSQPIVMGGRKVGTIRVARPIASLTRMLHDFTLVLGALVPLALAFTVGGGVWMAGKVVKPIQDSMMQLQRFTADASHELRTPVQIIQAQLDVLLEAPPADEAGLRRSLEPIQRATRRMAALVSDLLFLARTDTLETQLSLARLDLDELVEAAVDEYGAVARAKGLLLTLDARPIKVAADPLRLHQLVGNLIDNAIKYTDAGTIQVSVAPGPDGTALVRVKDSGIGIAPEHLPRVFDRFFRADAARSAQRPGTGLGLAIVQAVARAHHGDVQVESELDRGTVVTVTLPAGA